MKLFTAHQIKSIETSSIREGVYSSLELMDRAASAFTRWFMPLVRPENPIVCLSGKGNNGADGLVIGAKLLQYGYDVEFLVADFTHSASEEFNHHFERIKTNYNNRVSVIQLPPEQGVFEGKVVIDALFGNGLNRPLEGHFATLIATLNDSGSPVYAVDIPSGMSADSCRHGLASRCRATLSFQFPKISFFYKENKAFIGQWSWRSIGLDSMTIENTVTSYFMIDKARAQRATGQRQAISHKGDYGHVLGITTSPGMAGAGILCARSALRAGAGLCTLYVPEINRAIVQTAVPEAMVHIRDRETEMREKTEQMTIAIGPGLGIDKNAEIALKLALEKSHRPMVIDADGLNMLALHREWIKMIPENSILTPHPGEFKRLVGTVVDSEDQLEKQLAFSRENRVLLVLKDHHTCITTPEGDVYWNNTGNAGMATGGSGDVLTGIIAGFLARGLTPADAATAAVYIHGLCGDAYVRALEDHSLLSGDLIEYLPGVLRSLRFQ